jgi:hypothetical protein
MAEVIGVLREDATHGENWIFSLRQDGYRDGQIAVLVRLSHSVQSIHGFRGPEGEVVFVPHLQNTLELIQHHESIGFSNDGRR